MIKAENSPKIPEIFPKFPENSLKNLNFYAT